ncbi:MAG TPA: hypothetical protein VKA34_12110 [Balneolales bacterium]|nr:hypothetical protein [Balneolales bacterium]
MSKKINILYQVFSNILNRRNDVLSYQPDGTLNFRFSYNVD